MRRKDREITDREKINEVICSCHCCRLGFTDDGSVYIVPLSFGYEDVNGKRTFYFHSAKEGRKIDLINKTHRAAFELDTGYKLNEAETPCSFSARFQSVTGSGKVDFIEEAGAKKHALASVMRHLTGKTDWDFPKDKLDAVAVFKLEAEELSCKEHM